MHIHQPLVRYRRICICSKKIFVRGVIRGIYFYICLLQRLSREGGQNRHMLPLYTSFNMHKSNKNTTLTQPSGRIQSILSWSPPILSDDSLSGLETSFWEWLALACQLRCKNEKILCIHPLEHFLCHFQLVWAYRGAYSYTWMTFRSPDLLKWLKGTPQPPIPAPTSWFLWVNESECLSLDWRGWKWTRFAKQYAMERKTKNFMSGPPSLSP